MGEVLTQSFRRRRGQKMVIGGVVRIWIKEMKVDEIDGTTFQVVIQAPTNITVDREEIHLRKEKEKVAAQAAAAATVPCSLMWFDLDHCPLCGKPGDSATVWSEAPFGRVCHACGPQPVDAMPRECRPLCDVVAESRAGEVG